ncbi:MAG TPA: ATP-dependent DNA ligase [Candidatus Dormibacteraeota bacterium]|jgi:DNA ligase-1|nr:ATP-dependent DNA ligase [Candidatus Dormibacteraeota bacterium]
MARLSDLADLRARVAASAGRLEKRRLVAEYLRSLAPDDLTRAVTYLSGRAFPASDARVLNVRGLPAAFDAPPASPLTLADVAEAFGAVASASGAGARRLRESRLGELAARASEAERDLVQRIIYGEMRMGLSEGLVLEAIAEAAGVAPAVVRRAALVTGDLTTVAALALGQGAEALAAAAPRVFVPLLPMLAEIAGDVGEALAAHGGTSGMEFKYDGARIQLHGDGERVAIWSRRLSDVTRSLPDIVAIARRDLSGAPFILDGEVVALDAAGRPLPFQELMRRFRRVRGVEAAADALPLALHLFDCLMADGRSYLDEPYARRWEALDRVTGGRWLAERAVISTAEAGEAFMARALAAGHEGAMAKDPRSPYEPGGRGKRWFKLKAALTVDCVIVAADRGSGRRVGWLSNYHLAVRDGDGWADVGKTFKGLTDREFTEMTERLRALATDDDGYTVRVRPEVVVEVDYNEIQKSPTYPSGFALRFARIARIREDKAPGQATTLEELRGLYERQFATKGRAEP